MRWRSPKFRSSRRWCKRILGIPLRSLTDNDQTPISFTFKSTKCLSFGLICFGPLDMEGCSYIYNICMRYYRIEGYKFFLVYLFSRYTTRYIRPYIIRDALFLSHVLKIEVMNCTSRNPGLKMAWRSTEVLLDLMGKARILPFIFPRMSTIRGREHNPLRYTWPPSSFSLSISYLTMHVYLEIHDSSLWGTKDYYTEIAVITTLFIRTFIPFDIISHEIR